MPVASGRCGCQSADSSSEKDRVNLTEEQKKLISKYEGIPIRLKGFLKFGRNDAHPDPNFVGVEKQGPEFCNCHSDNDNEVDYHITLVNKRTDGFPDAVIVEMAPRVRAKHPTWNLPNLREYTRKGFQVRIYDWLMFDGEHKELMFDHKTQINCAFAVAHFGKSTQSQGLKSRSMEYGRFYKSNDSRFRQYLWRFFCKYGAFFIRFHKHTRSQYSSKLPISMKNCFNCSIGSGGRKTTLYSF